MMLNSDTIYTISKNCFSKIFQTLRDVKHVNNTSDIYINETIFKHLYTIVTTFNLTYHISKINF